MDMELLVVASFGALDAPSCNTSWLNRSAYIPWPGEPWFTNVTSTAPDGELVEVSGKACSNNTKPAVYHPPHNTPMPYPEIVDYTEFIAAFTDIVDMLPPSTKLIVDIGSGPCDNQAEWVEAWWADRYASPIKMLSADPFARSAQHNLMVQASVEKAGGADVATSMGVINVIEKDNDLLSHVGVLYRALRPGGLALLKVWAGYWPKRGSGVPTPKPFWGPYYQHNKWASGFLCTVRYIFDVNATLSYVDEQLHLLVLRKPEA